MTQEEIQNLIKSKSKRFCKKCNKQKTCDQFFLQRSKGENSWRFNSPCKDCYKIRQQSDYKKKYLKFYLKLKKFGISESDYNNMLDNQNHCCAICGFHKKYFRTDLAIDHCHRTGKIRALLCNNCNAGIGMLKDDIVLLKKAMEYLILWEN
jgi:hypothetical protein